MVRPNTDLNDHWAQLIVTDSEPSERTPTDGVHNFDSKRINGVSNSPVKVFWFSLSSKNVLDLVTRMANQIIHTETRIYNCSCSVCHKEYLGRNPLSHNLKVSTGIDFAWPVVQVHSTVLVSMTYQWRGGGRVLNLRSYTSHEIVLFLFNVWRTFEYVWKILLIYNCSLKTWQNVSISPYIQFLLTIELLRCPQTLQSKV